MANLSTSPPLQTGDIEHDFNELYSWANRLVSELRSLLHTLDGTNVISLEASRITGTINAARLGGTAPMLAVDGGGGVVFVDGNGDAAAELYASDGALYIKADKVFINGNEYEGGAE